MTERKERFVFRTGLSKDIPALIEGEGGFDLDTRNVRVGDGSSIPAMVPTDQSVGGFTYQYLDYLEVKELRIIPGGLVDGLRLSDIRSGYGMVVYASETDAEGTLRNHLTHRELETDARYLTIENPSGRFGNPRISISSEFLDLIESWANAGGFSWGDDPPKNVNPGHMFWSNIDNVLYVLITNNGTDMHWVDIGTAGGGGGGSGNRTWMGTTVPTTPLVGDHFVDLEDDYRRYLYVRDTNGLNWVETRL